MLASFFQSSPTVLLAISLALFVDSEVEIGTGLFPLVRSRSVMELGGMGRAEREQEDVTEEADPSKGAKIAIARLSHGSIVLGVGNEGLPPRRFLVAASS